MLARFHSIAIALSRNRHKLASILGRFLRWLVEENLIPAGAFRLPPMPEAPPRALPQTFGVVGFGRFNGFRLVDSWHPTVLPPIRDIRESTRLR